MRARVGVLCAMAGIVGACDPLGIKPQPANSVPNIAGTYTAQFQYQLGGATPVIVPGTMTMSAIDGNGNFTGTFTLTTPYTGSGTVSGVYTVDPTTGNADLGYSQFGDASKPLLFQGALFASLFPNCNFANAQFTIAGGTMTNQTIALQGAMKQITCTSNDSTTTPTLEASGAGTR